MILSCGWLYHRIIESSRLNKQWILDEIAISAIVLGRGRTVGLLLREQSARYTLKIVPLDSQLLLDLIKCNRFTVITKSSSEFRSCSVLLSCALSLFRPCVNYVFVSPFFLHHSFSPGLSRFTVNTFFYIKSISNCYRSRWRSHLGELSSCII